MFADLVRSFFVLSVATTTTARVRVTCGVWRSHQLTNTICLEILAGRMPEVKLPRPIDYEHDSDQYPVNLTEIKALKMLLYQRHWARSVMSDAIEYLFRVESQPQVRFVDDLESCLFSVWLVLSCIVESDLVNPWHVVTVCRVVVFVRTDFSAFATFAQYSRTSWRSRRPSSGSSRASSTPLSLGLVRRQDRPWVDAVGQVVLTKRGCRV